MTSWSGLPTDIEYIDTHCHVDLLPNPTAAMAEARKKKIGLVAVTNTPSVFPRMRQLAHPFDNVICALGLHPELVAERESEVPLFRKFAAESRFIGEVGLDGSSPTKNPLSRQQACLTNLLDACRHTGPHVLTVHSRRAVTPLLEVIEPGFSHGVILHWFSGTEAQARVAIERGWLFSINLVMTRSAAGQRLIAMIPPSLVLTESDSPLLRHGDTPAQSTDVIDVTVYLARQWKVEEVEARAAIRRTFDRISAG